MEQDQPTNPTTEPQQEVAGRAADSADETQEPGFVWMVDAAGRERPAVGGVVSFRRGPDGKCVTLISHQGHDRLKVDSLVGERTGETTMRVDRLKGDLIVSQVTHVGPSFLDPLQHHHSPQAGGTTGPPELEPEKAAGLGCHSKLEEVVVNALLHQDGLTLISSREIAENIQLVYGRADERTIRSVLQRMRDRNWPITTVRGKGSRIRPEDRPGLPKTLRE